MSRFNILNKAEEVCGYAFEITEMSPKKTRRDIVIELRTLSMTIIENIIQANDCIDIRDESTITKENLKERAIFQHKAKVSTHLLDAIAEIAMNSNAITKHQFDVLTEKTACLFDMIVKWEQSDRKNLNVQ